MRTSNTFSILFWINSSRIKNNLSIVNARITVNGKRATISLKAKADIRFWDNDKQRAKGNREDSRRLNLYLDQVHSQLVQCYQ
jgi:integrase/recombinase XerD